MKWYTVIVLIFSAMFSVSSLAITTQTTLPLEFNTGNPSPFGMPSTTIEIDGKKIPLILDTGALHIGLALSERALKGIEVKYTGKTSCFKAYDGEHCQKEFIVPKVKIGDFYVENVHGIVMKKLWGGRDKNFKETPASLNGVIGLALLSQFNLLLDYKHSKAILVKFGYEPFQYYVDKWIPIQSTQNLTTHLKINDKSVILLWDTGANPSNIRKETVHDFKKIPCSHNRRYDSESCLRVEIKSFTTDSNKKLPPTWFLIMKIPSYAPFDGLVGSNFYRNNLVYFDFLNHYIYVKTDW